MTKKYVISGGPAAGKTSLIFELSHRGYYIVEESAFKIMQQIPRITNWKKFNHDVFEKQMNSEASIPTKEKVAFLDRSLIDEIAYMEFYKIDYPKEFLDKIKEAKYEKVFFLNTLPDSYYNVTLTGQPRRLPLIAARQLHDFTKRVYKRFEIPMIEVPFLNIKTRADFVVNRLK